MFCTFIFDVLLLKYCFPTGDQLERYCASDISYSSQVAYNCTVTYYLNGVTEQSKRHSSGMTSPMQRSRCIQALYDVRKLLKKTSNNEHMLHARYIRHVRTTDQTLYKRHMQTATHIATIRALQATNQPDRLTW